jgi:5-(carboxyamino)imidazole ribonucleotide synthase
MSSYFPPGSTIGILGGGQLGRMLTIAARRMGYRVVSWIGGPDSGPAGMADVVIEEAFDSHAGFAAFVSGCDVATVEFENIPQSLLNAIAAEVPLMPGPAAVSICQHREREKRFLSENGFPCAGFSVISSAEQLRTALHALPVNGGILKTAEFGYDGKGQVPVNRESDGEEIWARFDSARAVLEERVSLAAELSVLVVRDRGGNTATYDPVENIHRDHILDVSIVPARMEPELLAKAEAIAIGIATALDYVGILAVEFFVSSEGKLLVNEMAPRPHNSGHHTIDACETSQFEQQLRVLAGMPIGSTRLHSSTVMLNLLGDVWINNKGEPDWCSILKLPGASLHLYGKHEARCGRKMGHITFTAATPEAALNAQRQARKILRLPKF